MAEEARVSRAALAHRAAIALLVALAPRAASASDGEAPRPADGEPSPRARAPRDQVWLRDGRQIEGRIVERAPGRWVVLQTDDGHRRTFAWDTVEEVDAAEIERPATLPAGARDAWRRRSGGGPTYELRAALSTLAMPDQTFHLTGTCSTGSGQAPVSMYGQSASDGALGFGGGIGGRFGWMHRSEMHADGATSWWGLRVGSGIDLLVYQLRTPTDLPGVNGGLCSEVSKRTYDLHYESSSTVAVQVPLELGGHVAFGNVDETRWSGFVVGLAYAPTFVQAAPFSSRSSAHLNPLGFALTVDFAVLHARGKGERAPEPQVRVSVFVAPPTVDTQPALGTLSLGAVWY